MKKPLLDQYEQEIIDAFENDVLVSVPSLVKETRRLKIAAKNKLTQLKNKNINIRLTQNDLMKLKSIAQIEGLPYQTLVGSVLHKFVTSYTLSDFSKYAPTHLTNSTVSEEKPEYK